MSERLRIPQRPQPVGQRRAACSPAGAGLASHADEKAHAAHENHERWLVSYADFITLLFAFFVVMFRLLAGRQRQGPSRFRSVREALEHGQFTNTLATVLGRGRHEASRPPNNPDG